jgi:hypothetical protein
MAQINQYRRELAAAEAAGIYHVTEEQFIEIATVNGWELDTIRMLLIPPTCGKTFLIGKAAVRIAGPATE